jgi:hypothetical protein
MRTAGWFRFLLLLAGTCLMTRCQGCLITPNTQPTQSPSLDVSVFDFTNRTFKDITGTRGTPTASNPFAYAGELDDSSETTFDSSIGVRAHDPTGVQQLELRYNFFTCSDVPGNSGPSLIPLTSFNNTATTGQSVFTITSTPGPPNNNQAPTDLALPLTVTTADLQSVQCPNGKNSSGQGTIELLVTASNFSTNPNTRTTQGVFDIRIGPNSPVPQPPGTGGQ